MSKTYSDYFIYGLIGIGIGILLTNMSPIITLASIIGLIIGYLIFTDTNVGVTLIAVIAILPLARRFGPIIVPLVDIIMLITIFSWLLKTILYRQKIRFPSLNIATTALLAMMIISIGVSKNRPNTIKEIFQYIIFAYMYTTMLFNNIKSVAIIDRMMTILTVGTATMGGYAFLRFLQIGQGGLYLFGMHKNFLGGILVLPLSFLYMKWLSTRNKFWLIFICANVAGLAASLSRGAWVGGLVGLLVVSFIYSKKEFLKVISLLCLAGILLYIALPKAALERTTSVHTLSERGVYWSAAIQGIKAKPLLGWGYANFWEVSVTFHGNHPLYLLSPDPHNVYLRFAAELGLIGLGVFLFFMYFIFSKATKTIKTIKQDEKRLLLIGLTGSISAYFAHGFFDVFWVRGTGSLFWIFLSLLFVLIDQKDLPLIEKKENKI